MERDGTPQAYVHFFIEELPVSRVTKSHGLWKSPSRQIHELHNCGRPIRAIRVLNEVLIFAAMTGAENE
jgi:hypothetical protein